MRIFYTQLPHVMWKMGGGDDEETTQTAFGLSEMETASAYSLSDPESIETYEKLDENQLAKTPSIEEICGKSPQRNNHKFMFISNELSPHSLSLIRNGNVVG